MKNEWRNLHRFEHRQEVAGFTFAILLIVVPLVTLLGMLFVTAWFSVTHLVPDIHATIWGWLSYRNKYREWKINNVAPAYALGIITLYLFYQIGELMNAGFRNFQRVLR